MSRRVIVNADDLGLSPGVNHGIVRAHLHGVVTSASLMVDGGAAEDAAALTLTLPDLSIGLHLQLDEYQVVDDEWQLRSSRVDLGDRDAVRDELRRQVDRFVELMGQPPTHIDSHQHVHLDAPVLPEVISLATALSVPVRSIDLPYRGSFYGQYGAGIPYPDGVTSAALIAAIVGGREETTEVGCHPATVADMDDTYTNERVLELEALCNPAVCDAVERAGVSLVNRSGRTRSRASAGRAVS